MANIDKIVKIGGILALLVFIHFFIDWVFQSHDEAMVKHKDSQVRAKHCLIYTIPFVFFMYYMGFSWCKIVIGTIVLFLSHFVEDTYIPVYLWAKYIRKPPQMKNEKPNIGFSKWIGGIPTPVKNGIPYDPSLAKILMIAIDQIIHIAFLLPIAFMAIL